ncbi:MAG: dihydroneopterin aldolase [Thermoleophilia bacterium]
MNRSLSISIEGIELRGRCGVSAEERAVGQTLVVDVRLEPAQCPGALSDDIAGTVNYGQVVDVVRGIVEGGEFHLLERLATVIADALWAHFDLAFLEVAVSKPSPPVAIPIAAARVEVVRTA